MLYLHGPGGVGKTTLLAKYAREASGAGAPVVRIDGRNIHVEGERTRATRFINWYLGRLRVAARHDPVVANAYGQVINLMQPPPTVIRPPIAARVLWGNLRPRRRLAVQPIPAPSLARG